MILYSRRTIGLDSSIWDDLGNIDAEAVTPHTVDHRLGPRAYRSGGAAKYEIPTPTLPKLISTVYSRYMACLGLQLLRRIVLRSQLYIYSLLCHM